LGNPSLETKSVNTGTYQSLTKAKDSLRERTKALRVVPLKLDDEEEEEEAEEAADVGEDALVGEPELFRWILVCTPDDDEEEKDVLRGDEEKEEEGEEDEVGP
jgi:hypothetical protein